MKGKTPHGSNYRQERAKKIVKKSGYASGGSTGEPDDCPTKDNPKCKKSGGPVSGVMSKKRLDKPRRYASGGGVMGDGAPKKKGSSKTEVNIVIAGKDGAQTPPMLPPPMPPMPQSPPPSMPPVARPPMGGPSAGMTPPPGAMKRGGAVKSKKYPIDCGAGGGKGRLEKAAASKSHRSKRDSDD